MNNVDNIDMNNIKKSRNKYIKKVSKFIDMNI